MAVVEGELATRRREQIIGAAVDCFARRGFHRTTMPEICAEAKLSPGTVYRYFRSKDELIEALVEADLAESLAFIERIGRLPTTAAVVESLIDGVVAGLAEPVRAVLEVEIVAEAARNPRVRAAVERYDERTVGALAEVLRAGQGRGEVDPALEPETAASLIFALVDGLTTGRAVIREMDLGPYAAMTKLAIGRFMHADPTGRGT